MQCELERAIALPDCRGATRRDARATEGLAEQAKTQLHVTALNVTGETWHATHNTQNQSRRDWQNKLHCDITRPDQPKHDCRDLDKLDCARRSRQTPTGATEPF